MQCGSSVQLIQRVLGNMVQLTRMAPFGRGVCPSLPLLPTRIEVFDDAKTPFARVEEKREKVHFQRHKKSEGFVQHTLPKVPWMDFVARRFMKEKLSL